METIFFLLIRSDLILCMMCVCVCLFDKLAISCAIALADIYQF